MITLVEDGVLDVAMDDQHVVRIQRVGEQADFPPGYAMAATLTGDGRVQFLGLVPAMDLLRRIALGGAPPCRPAFHMLHPGDFDEVLLVLTESRDRPN
jgi:hypothetical protein